MKKLLAVVFILMPLVDVALADITSGGATWTDTTVYQKPAFLSISYGPVEATSSNKYYVDLASGSGTTCSSASPCALSSVGGKPGTNGNGCGAFVYVRGSGSFGSPTLWGAAGCEVVMKPWTGQGTATFTGRNNITTRIQYLIIDGGPQQQIWFTLNGPNQFDPSLYLDNTTAGQISNWYFYRVHFHTADTGDWITDYGSYQDIYIINSEFEATSATDTGDQHHIYFSGCGGSSQALNGLHAYNNIFYNTPGEAFEFRIVNGATMSNVTISGNAFHDLGIGTCSNSWHCRSAVTWSLDSSGCSSSGSFGANLLVANNLIWNVGEGCMRTWDNPSTLLVYNNTCYNWGDGTGTISGLYGSAAFADFSFDCSVPGTFVNNTLYATGTFDGAAKTPYPNNCSLGNHQACASGTACGTSSQTVGSGDFATLTSSSLDFLFPKSTSTQIGGGTNLFSTGVTTDYLGLARPSSGAFVIGAFQQGINSSLAAPSGLAVGP